MPKTRKFSVTLYPAYKARDREGYVTALLSANTSNPETHKRFDANTLAEALAVVEQFATAYGKACRAAVRVIEGRQPAGFEAATLRAVLQPRPSRTRSGFVTYGVTLR